MALPIRHLPVLQNWDCQGCTHCCRDYRVYITDAERDRIFEQGWTSELEVPPVVAEGQRYRLNQRADNSCVFLSDQGRCRIHEKFGSEAKPLPCRLYPFVLVPVGEHWRVGLRFSCPSAAKNQGRPLAEHESELRKYAEALERQENMAGRVVSPPALQRRQAASWPEIFTFNQVLLGLLKNREDRVERRWRKCLNLARLCRQARFDRIKGGRMAEFLNLLRPVVEAETGDEPASVPPPTWVGRILFRQVLAIYVRKDVGPDRGTAARGKLALLAAAWRFAVGKGPVPRVHGQLPETTFEQAEEARGRLSEDAEQALERYYLVKVQSLQFCGPSNFGMSFWDGLESLGLTLPAILWLARALHAKKASADGNESSADDLANILRAISIVDDNFGYSPHLGARRQRLSLGILARRGELDKLIAWYSR